MVASKCRSSSGRHRQSAGRADASRPRLRLARHRRSHRRAVDGRVNAERASPPSLAARLKVAAESGRGVARPRGVGPRAARSVPPGAVGDLLQQKPPIERIENGATAGRDHGAADFTAVETAPRSTHRSRCSPSRAEVCAPDAVLLELVDLESISMNGRPSRAPPLADRRLAGAGQPGQDDAVRHPRPRPARSAASASAIATDLVAISMPSHISRLRQPWPSSTPAPARASSRALARRERAGWTRPIDQIEDGEIGMQKVLIDGRLISVGADRSGIDDEISRGQERGQLVQFARETITASVPNCAKAIATARAAHPRHPGSQVCAAPLSHAGL